MKKKAASKVHKSHPHGKLIIGVVAVLLVLLAVGFTGNSLTGGYHIRGGTDRLYATNITISPETNSFSVYIPGRGLVAQDSSLMLKVHLRNASFSPNIGLGFKFDRGLGWTDSAWVVVKNLTPRALLTGSVVYYNGTNYILAQEGGYYRDDWHGLPAWSFADASYLPIHFVNATGYPNDCMHNYLRVAFGPHSYTPVPEAVYAQLEEHNLVKPMRPSWWLVKWKSKSFSSSLSLTGVYYQPYPRPRQPYLVRVGFVGNTGTSFAGSAFNGVTLKYVYNASIARACPIPPG